MQRWFRGHSLSLKLLIAMWVISSFATLVLTASQLFFDYQRDLNKLQENYSIIERSYLDAMAEHLWSYDTRLLELQLEGLSRLQGISYLRLVSDNKSIYEFGKSIPGDDSRRIFDIAHKDTQEKMGRLEVELDVASLQAKYFQQAFSVFIQQAAKTLFVVFCLYFIFDYILVSHIKHIVTYLKKNRERIHETLSLRRSSGNDRDELDILVDSINLFRSELLTTNQKLESLNQALEQKVIERTHQLTIKNESLEKAFAQIQRMQATLVAQERLASLGSLTASVAHEIRNPLNFVLNFSELLSETDDLQEVKQASQIILRHSQRIDQIVRSMQILSGYQNDRLESCDINEVLKKAWQNVLTHHASSFVPKISFQFDPCVQVPIFSAALQQAIANLIDNALYSLEKKRSRDSAFEPELILHTRCGPEFLEIGVLDNGGGVPENLGEKIFDPFFTTKSAGEGAGLGLTVAFNVAQKHKGSLKYSTQAGQWTEFILTLPLNHERIAHA